MCLSYTVHCAYMSNICPVYLWFPSVRPSDLYIYIYISIYLSICRITNCSLKFGGPVDKWLARLATLIVPKSPLLLLVIPVILDFRTSGGSMRTSCLCEAHARIMHEYHESTKMHAIGWNGWNDNEWFSMVQ